MHYHVSRGTQTYGPYTLADLQRYVASGHILLTDLAKNEEMTDWLPVGQILNPAVAGEAQAPPPEAYKEAYSGVAQPFYGAQPAVPFVSPNDFPDPPNLHWGLVLLFDLLTCGLFQIAWNLILSGWMRRVQPSSAAIFFYAIGYVTRIAYTAFYLPIWMETMRHVLAHDMTYKPHLTHTLFIYGLQFVAWVLRLVARFVMKANLEEHFNGPEPVGLRVNGIMVFFFGGLYLQAKVNEVNEIKQAIRYREGIR